MLSLKTIYIKKEKNEQQKSPTSLMKPQITLKMLHGENNKPIKSKSYESQVKQLLLLLASLCCFWLWNILNFILNKVIAQCSMWYMSDEKSNAEMLEQQHNKIYK